jgi:hypothetical protein
VVQEQLLLGVDRHAGGFTAQSMALWRTAPRSALVLPTMRPTCIMGRARCLSFPERVCPLLRHCLFAFLAGPEQQSHCFLLAFDPWTVCWPQC